MLSQNISSLRNSSKVNDFQGVRLTIVYHDVTIK